MQQFIRLKPFCSWECVERSWATGKSYTSHSREQIDVLWSLSEYYSTACPTIANWTNSFIYLRRHFDIFFTTFWWLSLKLGDKNTNCCERCSWQYWEANTKPVNSASYSCHILIGQLKWKPYEKCQKNGTKLTQTILKVCPSGNILMYKTVRQRMNYLFFLKYDIVTQREQIQHKMYSSIDWE